MSPDVPVLVVLDAAQVPRTGKRMPGVALLRAGNTVPCAKGLHRTQRWVSVFGLPPAEHGCRCAVCVGVAPTLCPKSTPSPAGCRALEVACAWALGHQRRAWMDAAGRAARWLVVLGDGAYSTRAFVQHLPPRTRAIGVLHADARLTTLPAAGQRRVDGEMFA